MAGAKLLGRSTVLALLLTLLVLSGPCTARQLGESMV